MQGAVALYDPNRVIPQDNDVVYVPVNLMPSTVFPKGCILALNTQSNTNEVQTLTTTGTTVTGGTFKLKFRGYTTTATFDYSSATKAAIQAALRALPSINGAYVTAGGSDLDGDGAVMTFTWSGLFAAQPVDLIEIVPVTAITGTGSPAATLTRTTPGIRAGCYTLYDDAGSNGANTARGVLPIGCYTNPSGGIVPSVTQNSGGDRGQSYPNTPMLIKGLVKIEDLVLSGPGALDANGVTDLGRVLTGSLASGVGLLQIG